MIDIAIGDALRERCPDLRLGIVQCGVENTDHSDELWTEIADVICRIESDLSLGTINTDERIAATRAAYKRCGKDPNRYRPSAEALRRRIVKGRGLYEVNALVDVINLVSLRTGYSIGGFDVDKIVGSLAMGIGRKDEAYQAIGRGELNIEGLPVLRDERGAIGTPTSDEERTKLETSTTGFLMSIYAFGGPGGLQDALDRAERSLKTYVSASNIETAILGLDPK